MNKSKDVFTKKSGGKTHDAATDAVKEKERVGVLDVVVNGKQDADI